MQEGLSGKGFTLIELLIAITIASLVMVGVCHIFNGGLKAWQKGMESIESSQSARVILNLISSDIRACFVLPQGTYCYFEGGKAKLEDGEASSLNLLTTSHISCPSEKESDLCEVGYFIDTDPKTKEDGLVRRLDTTPDTILFEGGRVEEVSPLVNRLKFKFYDGKKWLDTWKRQYELPVGIEISIAIKTESGSQIYETIVCISQAKNNLKRGNEFSLPEVGSSYR